MTSFLNFSSENNLRELSASSTAIKIFQYIGNFFALIFFASPLFQIIKLKLYKEHQDISNVPLFLILTIIFNCLFWLLNAFSGDLKDWIPLLVSNIGGLIINIVLLFFYLFVYLEKNIKKFLGFGFFAIDLIIEITYLTFRYIVDLDDKDLETFHLIGFVATIINVLMYSSPLQNIKKIVKEGKYEALPIYTLSVGFFVTLSFFIQGIISYCSADNKDDRRNAIETMVSNGVSFFLLSCLSGVYAYFYFNPPTPQKVSEVDINKGNMDDGLNEKPEGE